MTGAYLRQLHHHVGKDVEEAYHGVPQSAVGQRLLVPRARTLPDHPQHSVSTAESIEECQRKGF